MFFSLVVFCLFAFIILIWNAFGPSRPLYLTLDQGIVQLNCRFSTPIKLSHIYIMPLGVQYRFIIQQRKNKIFLNSVTIVHVQVLSSSCWLLHFLLIYKQIINMRLDEVYLVPGCKSFPISLSCFLSHVDCLLTSKSTECLWIHTQHLSVGSVCVFCYLLTTSAMQKNSDCCNKATHRDQHYREMMLTCTGRA